MIAFYYWVYFRHNITAFLRNFKTSIVFIAFSYIPYYNLFIDLRNFYIDFIFDTAVSFYSYSIEKFCP